MRLSQPYKSPNISGSDGEQTKGKKEEEEEEDSGGLPKLRKSQRTRRKNGDGTAL